MSGDLIPLPASLNECGCPRAQYGTHLTSCLPAREFDAIPLDQRDGYMHDPVSGRSNRHQGITWDYPLRFTAQVDVEVRIDPTAYIRAHQADYEAFEMEPGDGYAGWEKPMVFISSRIAEDLSEVYTRFGGRRWVSSDNAVVDEISEHPRWTKTDTDRLVEALGRADVAAPVDPNQTSMFEGGS